MHFLGQDPVRCKVIVANRRLRRVKNFKYLSCEISYENEKKMFNKKSSESCSNTGGSTEQI